MWMAEHRERYKDDRRRYPSDLTDAEWEAIAPYFAVYPTLTADLREMVNACLYLHKTGCGWRYLPKDFGPWETVRTWHERFRHDGIWSEISDVLTRAVRQQHGHAAEPSTAILDSQSLVSGPQKGERGVDGHKQIKGIKRHVLACSLGFVLAVLVTPANVHDTPAAGPLLDRAAEHGWAPKRVKVDGIYTQGIRTWNLLDIPAGACAARARSILPSGVADTLRGRTAWIGSSPAGRVWKTRAPAMPGCTTSTNC